jgi:hypothetical protein
MKPWFCDNCDAPIKVQDDYDPLRCPVVCSIGCWKSEYTFMKWMSDEEINRRNHYKELTRGEE